MEAIRKYEDIGEELNLELPEETFEEFAEAAAELVTTGAEAEEQDTAELLAVLIERLTNFNAIVNTSTDAETAQRAATALALANESKVAYNKSLIYDELHDCLTYERPMLEALKRGFIGQKKITLKNHKSKQGQMEVVTVEAILEDGKPMTMPLQMLEKEHVGQGMLCENGQWPYMAEKFAMLMNARATAAVGGDTRKFSRYYKIQEKARECDVGATPTSNSQIQKALQAIVDGILFIDNGKGEKENIYKVTGYDVKFIELTMIREGNRAGIVCCRPQTMIKLITKALHRIVTGGKYDVEYQMVEEKKA